MHTELEMKDKTIQNLEMNLKIEKMNNENLKEENKHLLKLIEDKEINSVNKQNMILDATIYAERL